MIVENATTVSGLRRVVQYLASGTSWTVKGIFHGHSIGAGSYRKEGHAIVVVQERGEHGRSPLNDPEDDERSDACPTPELGAPSHQTLESGQTSPCAAARTRRAYRPDS